MNPWQERFQNHPLWTVVDDYSTKLESVPVADGSPELDSIVRLKSVLQHLREHQESGTSDLISEQMLASTQSALAQVISVLTTYLNDPISYANYLKSAADQLDQVLDQLAKWPPLPAQGQARAAGRTFKEHDKAARDALDDLNNYYQKLKEKNENLMAEFESLKSQIGQTLENTRVSLEEREGEYSEAVRLVELSGQEAFDRAIARDLSDRVTQIENVVQRSDEQLLRAESAAKKAEEHRDSSEVAASWIAEQAVATDFGRQARNKAVAGWFYDILGAVTGGVPLILLLVHFLNDSTVDGNAFSVSVARASVTIAALVIAGYFFSRGSTNHRQARNSKSADIRLRLLEAFLARLGEEEAAEVRRGMAETIFLRGKLSDEEPDGGRRLITLFGRNASDDSDSKDEDEK
ncbi:MULTISPECIES: hypothetical protein [unclassified Rhodococcus (in: high G+C Gram-positive bacteria)]|uniref:hypothetical protein n=1 Tax=unclassified Rhodococcus (in: high G+C Gram-positive bacteria) TaxID=192944 RepID=UPI000AD73704|nr:MULTISPECIES: hypothetical protein [unclassified Rhodococcus (in: high G+C Gram-positive bacteria)]